MGGDPLKFAPATDDNALTVDPTDPNASVPAHTPEWSNLRSSDPMETPGPDDNVAGLPAVQTDDGLLLHDDAAYSLGQSMGFSPDAFDFTTEPTEPVKYTKTYFGVTNANCDKLDDGGIIIDWTPGPDDDGFLIINWLAEDHVDPSDPSLDLPIAEFAAETTGNARLGWDLRYAYASPVEDGGTRGLGVDLVHEGWVLM